MENPPVAAAPAVDRLLDVAHDQHRGLLGLGHRIAEERQEVLPLLDRRILKLVDHEAFEAVADFLVDERRVVVSDEFGEDVFRLGEQHHVLLVAHALHLGVEVREQGEAAVVLAQQRASVPRTDVAVVEVAHRAQQRLQSGDERRRRRTLRTPPLGRGAHLRDRRTVGLDLAVGHGVEPVGEAAALAREVGGREPCRGDDADRLGGRFAQPGAGRFGVGRRLPDDASELFARARRGERLLVLLLEELAAQRENAFADIPFAPLVDALLHEIREPTLQIAVDGDLLDQRIGALREHRRGLDLDVVVEVDAELLDEGAQDALEKGVDRENRKARVVVQDARPRLGGPFADRCGVEPQLVAQPRQVGALPARSQAVDLLENTALHLLGGLVGKGHGQDMTVGGGTLHDVVHVLVGQLIGLARTGARIQNDRSHAPKREFFVVKVRNKSRTAAAFDDNFVI